MCNDHAYLRHIRDSLHDVQTFVRGESYESFLENRMVQNAVNRSFEVVSEAARRTSAELREAHPEVPWRLMSDFRNKLIHDYFGLDLEVIWRTATGRYPGPPPRDREADGRGMNEETNKETSS
jgi:uncharacterized protein with HEPN domain